MRQPGAEKETNMTNGEATTAAGVAEQGATVAPETTTSKKRATRKQGAPKSQKPAKAAKKKAPATKKRAKAAKKAARGAATAPRPESKGAKVLELIGRAKGATFADIVKATGWQKHTIRGFLSIAAKKHAIHIESVKNEVGDRVYSISK